MATPHVLKVRKFIALGVPHSFELVGLNLGTATSVNLYEANPAYEWTDTTFEVISATEIIVTSTPVAVPDAVRPPHGPYLDGGGDGDTTITVTDPGFPDPDPPVIYTYYTSD